jgi:hypothetical protein
MNPRRFAISAAALFGMAILVGGVIAAVAGFGMADVKNTHGARIDNRATEKGEVSLSNAEAVSVAAAVTAIAEVAMPDASQVSASETPPLQFAAVSSDLALPTPRRQCVPSKLLMNHCLTLRRCSGLRHRPCKSRQQARLTWCIATPKER